jgi:predicted MFS family arabinose efflux permease
VLLAAGSIGFGVCLGLAYMVPVAGWLAVAVVGVGTLLHGLTQVITAVMLPNAAPTGRAATMTLRGAASSLGAAAGAALGGLVLDASGFAMVGATSVAFGLFAAALAWWGRVPAAPQVRTAVALSEGSRA